MGDGTSGTIERSCGRSHRGARVIHGAGDRMGAASALQSIGHLLYDKGNFTDARKSYEDASPYFAAWAIKIAPRFAQQVGNIYYDQGDLVQARQYYEQSLLPIAKLMISPDWPAAWEILPMYSTAWAICLKH